MENQIYKVFISRELRKDSPLLDLGQIKITDQSLLSFTPVPFSDLPDSDWIFFYSQQGVIHFFEQWQETIQAKLAAFGPKTGSLLREYGYPVTFIGDGIAENTAKAFSLLCKGQKVLFVRARNSRKSLQHQLRKYCDIGDLVVYDNEKKAEVKIPDCNALIFTSPLNAQSYFERNDKSNEQIIIAIGDTTRQTLLGLGVSDILVPEKPSEESIAKLLTEIFSV